MRIRNFLLTIFISVFVISSSAHATSWAEMSPELVEERADVIVLGTYDFSNSPQKGELIFRGYPFQVVKVLKGEAAEKITAGIDMYDVSGAEKFQQEGGQFLLFLQDDEYIGFLTPVGGPNGMVHVQNGEVDMFTEKPYKKNFYDQILKSRPKTIPTSDVEKPVEPLYNNTLPAIPIVVLIAIVFVMIRRKKAAV